jgi:hypothetical protein
MDASADHVLPSRQFAGIRLRSLAFTTVAIIQRFATKFCESRRCGILMPRSILCSAMESSAGQHGELPGPADELALRTGHSSWTKKKQTMEMSTCLWRSRIIEDSPVLKFTPVYIAGTAARVSHKEHQSEAGISSRTLPRKRTGWAFPENPIYYELTKLVTKGSMQYGPWQECAKP